VNASPSSTLHTTVIVESTVDHTLNPGGTSFENDQYTEKTDIVDYTQDSNPPAEYHDVLTDTTNTYQSTNANSTALPISNAQAIDWATSGAQPLNDAVEAGNDLGGFSKERGVFSDDAVPNWFCFLRHPAQFCRCCFEELEDL
jgi:hypothetical protein